MAYAIIETSGTQLWVEPGRFYDINRLDAGEDDSVTFDRVLFVENDGDMMVGQPVVEGVTVEGTIQRHLRGRKVIVYKMKPKKKTRKKRGHRQELTRVMINSITRNGSIIAGEAAAESKATASSTQASAAEPDAESEADAES